MRLIMYKLYFYNSFREAREIATFEDEMTDKEVRKAVFDEITKFCNDRNSTIYYTRMWNVPDGDTIIDVGSHTEFFHVSPQINILE